MNNIENIYLINRIINDTEIGNEVIDELLNDNNVRKSLYTFIHGNMLPMYRKVVLRLIQIEIKHREDTYEDYEMFYWCIFLLHRFGEVSDVETIWKAKYIDFDSSFGVEAQFLVGAGLEKTIDYLKAKNTPETIDILNGFS